jgi:hypothetical protein
MLILIKGGFTKPLVQWPSEVIGDVCIIVTNVPLIMQGMVQLDDMLNSDL